MAEQRSIYLEVVGLIHASVPGSCFTIATTLVANSGGLRFDDVRLQHTVVSVVDALLKVKSGAAHCSKVSHK